MADANIRPALTDVGAILRARTRSDATGAEVGTFDATTRPTATAVTSFIDLATGKVRLRLPAEIPDDLEPFVKHLVALRAAMSVERSYDPDRTGEGTAYADLKEEFDEDLAALLAALDDRGEDVTTEGRQVSATLVSPYSGDAVAGDDIVEALIGP